jgi:hypothetical protein
VATVVVGLIAAVPITIVAISDRAEQQRCAVAIIQDLDYDVWYDFDVQYDNALGIPRLRRDRAPSQNHWFRHKKRRDFFQDVVAVVCPSWKSKSLTDDDLACLECFSNLEFVHINADAVTDCGAKRIAQLGGLRVLIAHHSQITDDGFAQLASLPSLRVLSVARSRITDAGLGSAASSSSLLWLDIRGTAITDAALEHFMKMPKLQVLDLVDTQVSAGGAASIQSVLPECVVLHPSIPKRRIPFDDEP